MANTYTQIHLHVVFAVRYRHALIEEQWRARLHQYLIATFHHHGHRVLALNTMPDHLHVLFGYHVNQLLPRLIQEVKRDSTQWINKQGFSRKPFAWQEGYGAFAVNKRGIPRVAAYVQNQQEQHRRRSFHQEFEAFLRFEEIVYKPDHLFTEPQ